MLEYYSTELEKVGGESKGKWVSSLTCVIDIDSVKKYELVEERYFTSRSPVLKEGWPISSLEIYPTFKKYCSEITVEERNKLQEKTDKELSKIFIEILDRLNQEDK